MSRMEPKDVDAQKEPVDSPSTTAGADKQPWLSDGAEAPAPSGEGTAAESDKASQ